MSNKSWPEEFLSIHEKYTHDGNYFLKSPDGAGGFADTKYNTGLLNNWCRSLFNLLGWSLNRITCITTHGLRASIPTEQGRAGVSIETSKKQGGWKSLKSALMYRRISDQDVRIGRSAALAKYIFIL